MWYDMWKKSDPIPLDFFCAESQMFVLNFYSKNVEEALLWFKNMNQFWLNWW